MYQQLKLKKTNHAKCWSQCEQLATLLAGIKMVQQLWKTFWQFLKLLNTDLPYDAPIPLPGIFPRKRKHISSERLTMNVHSSFIKPQTGNNLHNLSTSERINKLRLYSHQVVLTIKRDSLRIHATNMQNSHKNYAPVKEAKP